MQLRPSQNDFDHQLGGYGSGQTYSNYHNSLYPQQSSGYGYANSNSYGQALHHGSYCNSQASQSVEIFSPKSFLSQNVSPKSPLIQSQQTLMNGGKMQNGNGLIVNSGSSISQQQLNQQINYSNSTSNLSTKRDYLSPTNRLQQQSTTSSLQQQQQIQQQPFNPQQNQLLQQQQFQQNQPLKNNFFQQSSNQIDNQNLYQGGYSVLNQQSSLQNQMLPQSATNGFGKKPQAPALQQQQQQQQQQFSQNNQQHYQLQQQQLKQTQLGMNAKVSPSATNANQNNTFSQQSSSQVQSGVVVSDMRHLSADALKDKENLQNPLQKIYYDQPSTKAQSTQKSSILGNQAMRPSSREGYTNSTQPSTLNSNRQQIRSSTNSNQIDNRLQRNSYSQQNLKTSNLNSTALGQNINNSQMKENLLMNGNYAFSVTNQSQPQGIYEQQSQIGYQPQKNSHMFQSGIVQTNSQLSNHNMKRSEIIEMKHSNYLNSPKYVPVNGNQQYTQQQLDTKESIDKKENYTLFPSNQNIKDKPLTADTRSIRQKSQYKDTSSQGNNNSSLQIENNPNSNSMTSYRKELQRVSSATTTYAAAQSQKKSQNFKYKTAKTSKISLQRDSQTPKSGEDKKISFSSDTKQMSDISQKEVSYGINTSSSQTTLRNNFVGTSQSQYIQPRQSAVLERKNGSDKSATLFNDTKGKQAQSTILTSAEQPNISTVSKSKPPNNLDGKKVGESRVYSDEYQEYKKLQEKLNYLESKIMSIKTNIDSTYQKEKEEQRKESLTGQQITDQNSVLSATRTLNSLNQTQTNKNSASTANLTTLPSTSLQNGAQSTPQGYLSPSTQSKMNQDSYSRSSLCSPDQVPSPNSTANQYSRDEELLYSNTSNLKATTNSFSLEQNSTKASGNKQGVSSSTINLYLKNGMNNQTQSTSSLNQVGNTSLNYTSNSTQNATAVSQSEQAISQTSNKSSANNPLSSFVTQVNRGSGIPLSPKTATNTAKRTKIEEKISSTIQYDPSQINTSLQPSIPKSYLNKSQQQQQLTQQNQSKIQDGSVASSSVNNSSSKSNNASYKKRDESDSIDGSVSQQGTAYYPSSTKNQTSQGKNSLILTKNSPETQSAQSLKNSNILASPTNNSAYKKNIQTTPPYIYYISPIIKAYMEPQNLSPFASLAKEHLIQTMQAISFSRMLKPASQKVIDEKKVHLPIRRDNKKTLVFDLDETLIHCNENANIPSDVILPIRFPTGEVIEAGINVRPYCMEILKELSKFYEIIVFTASHSCYANVVLDYLDPKGQYITGRLFRENCVTTEEGVYIKDLRVIANRNLSDIVLVDNAAYSFGFQIDNGIPIIPFYDNKSDAELKHLIHFMKSIHNVRDLREIVKKFLKIGSFSEFSDPHALIQNLFDDLIY
ncbi:hypothetical protein ABPG72_002787 [Tetrahymena utriculariae]